MIGLGQVQALEDEAVAIMREVAAQFRRPVLLFSGGKDSVVLLRLAEKAFRPAPLPFPIMHVDTGHNFPEVLEFRDRRLAELGEELIVASVPDAIAAGRIEDDPERLAQPAAEPRAARRDPRARLRRGLRRRQARRGARPRQGAGAVRARARRRLEAGGTTARAVATVERPPARGRARARLPDLRLDRARRLDLHRPRGPRAAVDLLLRTSARCSGATGCCSRSASTSRRARTRSA